MFRYFLAIFIVFLSTYSILLYLKTHNEGPRPLDASAGVVNNDVLLENIEEASIVANRDRIGSFHFEEVDPPIQPKHNDFSYKEPVDTYPTHKFRNGVFARKYHTYLGQGASPENFNKTVVLLHGSGRGGASMIDMWKETADANGIFLIAPDSYTGVGWSSFYDSMSFINALLEHANEHTLIDRDQLYLFGHSAGGRLVTTLVTAEKIPFKAVATHAGFNHPKDLSLSKDSPNKEVPIFFYLGKHDKIFPVAGSQLVGNAFAENGYDASAVIIKNHGHWYYELGPSLNQEIWANLSR